MSEQEPLLGRPGDVVQAEDRPIYENLILGAGIVAQAGIWILVACVWSGIFSHQLIFVSSHPLLNSASVLLFGQAALILQPTHTAEQKHTGTLIHAALNSLGFLSLLVGLVIIEVNKERSHPVHFQSPHAIMGLVTYILVAIQATVGILAFFYPNVFGSVDNAKSLYKYHRASGYFVLTWMCATVCAATWTTYNLNVLQIHQWSIIVASVLFLAALGARIKKQKLGF